MEYTLRWRLFDALRLRAASTDVITRDYWDWQARLIAAALIAGSET